MHPVFLSLKLQGPFPPALILSRDLALDRVKAPLEAKSILLYLCRIFVVFLLNLPFMVKAQFHAKLNKIIQC